MIVVRHAIMPACLAMCLVLAPASYSAAQVPSESERADAWWLKPHRLLQTNLREIDATMDLDRYLEEVEQFGADVVLFNVGGIVANYPTNLEFHYRNPHMKGDLVGTVLRRLHGKGIRMIGRFDFSKINERFAAQHPEWLYVSESGHHVNYNGQVHTCVSGGYQQEYMFKILGEAVDRYPLDGVFFNMIGYKERDYSGNQYGICQCENCRRLFREFAGLDLPRRSQENTEALRKYAEFTRMMQDRQFQRVHGFLKARRPDLAICTYTSTGVDVIRKESNSALGRGTYHDTDKAKFTLLTCGQRQLANAAVHFIRIPYRHAAVSPYLTARRLWQHMVNGAWLDFYCIGPLQRQEDRTGLSLAAEIYRFHRDHRKWLQDTRPAGDVGLVRQGDDEYLGLVEILSENHIAYDLISLDQTIPQQIKLVIVPDAHELEREACSHLDRFVQQGGKVLLTGGIPKSLKCMGKTTLSEVRPPQKGAYVRIRDEDRSKLAVPALRDLDLVFLDGTFRIYRTEDDVQGWLRFIPGDMFGPPEKCYYRTVSDHPALLLREYDTGQAACFTLEIGRHYHQQAHTGHAALVVGAIDQLLEADRRVKVEAPPLVEINLREDVASGFEWVSLYNHSGQRGPAIHAPLPLGPVTIRFQPKRKIARVMRLSADDRLPFDEESDGTITVTLPQLKLYDVVVFEYDGSAF